MEPETKRCSMCGKTKSVDEFYRDAKSADGRRYVCKICCKIYNAQWRQDNREHIRDRSNKWYHDNREQVLDHHRKYRKDNPEKRKAKDIINGAIKTHKLIRQPCVICGKEKAQGHHEDYARPYDVIWLCPKHHMMRHAETTKRDTEAHHE